MQEREKLIKNLGRKKTHPVHNKQFFIVSLAVRLCSCLGTTGINKKCSHVALKVCCALFSALWVPSFLTLALFYLHRCYIPAFPSRLICLLNASMAVGRLCHHCTLLFTKTENRGSCWLYNGWQSRMHMGSPPMRNHHSVKAVASLCKCNLALLHLASTCCCAMSECLL